MLRVAVTGATGFLGRRLVPRLMRAGHSVSALCRRDPEDAWDGRQPHIVRGELDDIAALEALIGETDVVVHVAGVIKARGRRAFFAINDEATGRVADQVARADRPRLIVVSSLAAREPDLSDYAASKRAGEAAAATALSSGLAVLRPPALYGPGDRETLALFAAARRSPVLPLLGPPESRLALAHVDDVVDAITALVERPLEGCFALGGARPEGYSWREILAAAAAVFGRRPWLVETPRFGVESAAAVSSLVARVRGRAAIFSPGKARELLHRDWSVSPAEQLPRTHLGHARTLADGFAQTVAWYASRGWL
ncbi:MAG TPA: NAD-dependent epimerase/dehydratase family protein [Caulobacteraceae bacterium]|jgi:nucleoside-diphosphate-sugar epimerase|nr:NAD-dependent epimerase/dehydratase family protein [Caulobacteraceae bacterium]